MSPWLALGNLDFRTILTIYRTKSGSRCLKCSYKQYILCWKCFVFFWEPGILVHASQVALVVKNPGNIRAMGLIPGSGRAPREGHGRLRFVGPQRIRHDWSDSAHAHGSRQRMPAWPVLSKTLVACVPVCSATQSCLTLCDPVDCGRQAPLSTGFSRQEYWSRLPFPTPGLVVVVQSLSRVQLFATPWTAAHQAFLSSSICRPPPLPLLQGYQVSNEFP